MIKNFISNLMFPNGLKCIACGKEIFDGNEYCLCEKCLKSLPLNNLDKCHKCGNPINHIGSYCLNCKFSVPNFEKADAPFVYEGIIKDFIRRLKFDGQKYLADSLSKLLFDEFETLNWKIDLIYPVPLFNKREKQRGYNQAEILCAEFKKHNYIVDKNNLIRTKNTCTQTNLSYDERQDNLKDAFKVLDKNRIKNKNIMLIDDVFTTGSTLKHCTDVLIKSGAKKVYCLTLAHTKYEKIFGDE